MAAKKESFSRYDSADYLKSEEDIAAYLDACSDENDPALMAVALGAVACARNMSQLARDTGLTREGLYKALSADGNPSLATAMKVANALGYQLRWVPAR
ncbi:addiction module antidote protein [Dyella sp.]|uniref:addiction module antidote protein n=1 Tax=Dyella sp. TaxID=1869338 RepID=UPI002FD9143A